MRSIIAILLVAMLAVAFTACSKAQPKTTGTVETENAAGDAAFEEVFNEFPEDETYSDDFQTLDEDLNFG
jgi:hypothetical protein